MTLDESYLDLTRYISDDGHIFMLMAERSHHKIDTNKRFMMLNTN